MLNIIFFRQEDGRWRMEVRKHPNFSINYSIIPETDLRIKNHRKFPVVFITRLKILKGYFNS
jgi:hypothetical protein